MLGCDVFLTLPVVSFNAMDFNPCHRLDLLRGETSTSELINSFSLFFSYCGLRVNHSFDVFYIKTYDSRYLLGIEVARGQH